MLELTLLLALKSFEKVALWLGPNFMSHLHNASKSMSDIIYGMHAFAACELNAYGLCIKVCQISYTECMHSVYDI